MRQIQAVSLIFMASLVWAVEWHHPLYIGNGGIWEKRIAITVRNASAEAREGEPVEFVIGQEAGQLPLAGTKVDSLRVCNEAGVEYLYGVFSPQGELLRRGPVPAGSKFVFAVDVPAQGESRYYVYWDNPAAWAVPDFFTVTFGVRNPSVEAGEGDTPTGWTHDWGDEYHKASWTTENPRSGQRCLKLEVAPGAPKSWISTRQHNIRIIPGAKYVMRGWVRAEKVEGEAGWYIHVGNSSNPMIISPMLYGGGGTYDWKEVKAEFTAPKEAYMADLGTVLWGTGTAWFDDVSLELVEAPSQQPLQTEIGPVERLALREYNEPLRVTDWAVRAPVRVMNWLSQPRRVLVTIEDSGLVQRMRQDPATAGLRVVRGQQEAACGQIGHLFVFEAELPPRSVVTYWLLFGKKGASKSIAENYEALLHSPLNLAKNPSFELGATLPEDWPGGAEGEKPAGASLGFDEPGLFGKRCVKIHVPHEAQKAWTGWRQNVPVEPGRTYLYAAWAKCADLRGGSLQLHAHKRTATGELCQEMPYVAAGPDISGTTDWTLMAGIFTMPEDCRFFQLHLTMFTTGTVWHDGVLLTETERGIIGPPEGYVARGLEVWPVPAIVKVFRHDVPTGAWPTSLTISLARNEYEPLQLAIRSPRALEQLRIEASAPVGPNGRTLPAPEINVVGYVPIDHAGGYYWSPRKDWQRHIPSGVGQSDGFVGMWPDPLLPNRPFNVAAHQTQPVWLTFYAPAHATAGAYSSIVKLREGARTLWQGRVTIHVRRFVLPEEGHCAAIYDVRQSGGLWRIPGKTLQEVRQNFWKFMAQRRLCPDRILPEPKLDYKNGQVVADFTEYDKAAEYYFNVLKLPYSYTPGVFYCFGWGHPPANKFGEKPYEGEYPYKEADRSRLRPEYKRAYQAVLKAYWEHMKAKGWAERIVLYMSDEPYDGIPEIRAQMKALCDMVHGVDPAIPIYVSNWHAQPEWEGGYINVWGVGHFGVVSAEKLKQLQAAGNIIWWTTDGQMCTDTPYCAIERLLPHYAFKFGAKAYEFWGIDWLTYNPYEFGWHSFIKQSGKPGEISCVRYPCGDGYLAYPGQPIGHPGPISSVRMEQAREGMEDYEYLWLLQQRIEAGQRAGKNVRAAEEALTAGLQLVDMPSRGGRFSMSILPEPLKLYRWREQAARALDIQE